MSSKHFWMPAALALGMMFTGAGMAHAQQAGATDPSIFNTGGPGATNDSRPTLVLPEVPSARAAAHPGIGALASGWSNVGGPYINSRGRAQATNVSPDDATTGRYARR